MTTFLENKYMALYSDLELTLAFKKSYKGGNMTNLEEVIGNSYVLFKL